MSSYSSVKRHKEAIDILSAYNGGNPYLLSLRNQFNRTGKNISDFNTEYVLKNHNFEPRQINKIIKVADWFAQEKMREWDSEILPEKILIIALLGETDTQYHCYVQYRKSVPPFMTFVPKKAVLTDFLHEDYHNFKVDFDRYDNLLHLKNSSMNIKAHQKEGVQFLLSRKKCILADDMGLGKTMQLSIAAVEGNFDSVLIVCPASLKTNWKKELSMFVRDKDITIIDGFNDKTKPELEKFLGYAEGKSNKTRPELLEEAKNAGKWYENRFVIINYDILDEFYKFEASRSKADKEDSFNNSPILQFLANKKSLLIVDEAHKLSNSKSTRYQVIQKLITRGKPDSVYLSTGTPITNDPSNFYNVLKLIENNLTGDWEYYVKRYCSAIRIPRNEKEREKRNRISNEFVARMGKRNWYELEDYQKDRLNEIIEKECIMMSIPKEASNLDELRDRCAHIYLRRTKDDLTDLPNKTVHEIFYNLSAEQMAEYNKLWDEYETAKLELDPTVELNKELIEGGIYRRYCSDQMLPYTKKLADFFINKGEKVVIACCYDNELYELQKYYGDKCVIYNGKMALKEKDAAMDAFLADDSKMVFIGNIDAAGVGITLISSHVLIFNDFDYVPGNNRQMEDRIYRIGQTHDVDIYYQMFNKTQYEKMWRIVLRKELVINSVIKKEEDKK